MEQFALNYRVPIGRLSLLAYSSAIYRSATILMERFKLLILLSEFLAA